MAAALRAAGRAVPPTAGVLSLLLELLEAMPPHMARDRSKGGPGAGAGTGAGAGGGGGTLHEGEQLGGLAHLSALGAAALGCLACLDLSEAAVEATAHFGVATEAEAAEARADAHIQRNEELRERQWAPEEVRAVRRLQARRRGQLGRRRYRAAAAAAAAAAGGNAEALAVAGGGGSPTDVDADADAAAGGAGGAASSHGSPAAARKASSPASSPAHKSTTASPPSSQRLAHLPGERGRLSTRAGAGSPGFNGGPGSPLTGGSAGERRIELVHRLARRLLDDLEALLPPSRPASRRSECCAAAVARLAPACARSLLEAGAKRRLLAILAALQRPRRRNAAKEAPSQEGTTAAPAAPAVVAGAAEPAAAAPAAATADADVEADADNGAAAKAAEAEAAAEAAAEAEAEAAGAAEVAGAAGAAEAAGAAGAEGAADAAEEGGGGGRGGIGDGGMSGGGGGNGGNGDPRLYTLRGHAALTHGHVCAALLALLQAGADAPPPPPKPPTPPPEPLEPVPPPEPPAGSTPGRRLRQTRQAQAQAQPADQGEAAPGVTEGGARASAEGGGGAGAGAEAGTEAALPPPAEHTCRHPSEDTCRHLTEAELRVVVGMLPASLGGSILGSALCWQQAAGCTGASGLQGADSKQPAAATLGALGAVEALGWELCEAAETRQLQGHAIAQATWAAAALWRLSLEPRNAEAVLAYRDAAVVRVMCALLPAREETGRRLRFAAVNCLCALLHHAARLSLTAPEAAAERYLLLYRLGAPARLHEMARDSKRPAPRRLAAARTLEAAQLVAAEMHAGGDLGRELPRLVRGTLPEGGLEGVMLALLAESDPALVAFGCRGLARAAMRGGGANERIVGAGGCGQLMAALRPVAAPRDAAAAALRHDALNAVLNLSGSRCARPELARHGLWTLVQLWYDSWPLGGGSAAGGAGAVGAAEAVAAGMARRVAAGVVAAASLRVPVAARAVVAARPAAVAAPIARTPSRRAAARARLREMRARWREVCCSTWPSAPPTGRSCTAPSWRSRPRAGAGAS